MLRENYSKEFKKPCVVVDSACFSPLEVMRLARKISAEINYSVDRCFLVEFPPRAPGPYTSGALYASAQENQMNLLGRRIRIEYHFSDYTYSYTGKVVAQDGNALTLIDISDAKGELKISQVTVEIKKESSVKIIG